MALGERVARRSGDGHLRGDQAGVPFGEGGERVVGALRQSRRA